MFPLASLRTARIREAMSEIQIVLVRESFRYRSVYGESKVEFSVPGMGDAVSARVRLQGHPEYGPGEGHPAVNFSLQRPDTEFKEYVRVTQKAQGSGLKTRSSAIGTSYCYS